MTRQSVGRVPGRALETVAAKMHPSERVPFALHLESKYLREGNLEYLREVRAYLTLLGIRR